MCGLESAGLSSQELFVERWGMVSRIEQVGITSLQGGVALQGWRGRAGLGCIYFKFILSSV